MKSKGKKQNKKKNNREVYLKILFYNFRCNQKYNSGRTLVKKY